MADPTPADATPAVPTPVVPTPVVPAPAVPAPVAPTPYTAPAATSVAPAGKTNVLAIVSLITSIIWLGLVGVITGHIALSQIKKTGEGGRGLAIAGLVIGYLGIAFSLIFGIIWLVATIAIFSNADYTSY